MASMRAKRAINAEFQASFSDDHKERLRNIDGTDRDDEQTDEREEQGEHRNHQADSIGLGMIFIQLKAEFSNVLHNARNIII